MWLKTCAERLLSDENSAHSYRMKNIELRADKRRIEQARSLPKSQDKTFIDLFREWQEQLTAQSGDTQEFDALMKRLKQVQAGRRFSRDVDATFPGWVECELVDAAGHCHTLRDKVPIFTVDDLGSDSRYPAPGIVACEVLERYLDEKGRELARIGTIKPWGIESTEGLCEFTVLASRLDSKDD